ncbi:MAG: multi-sensor hybrid histidine kinase [Rhodocyclaceae bacterium]|nr:MAG: multi-sensor hybrid histidine kinase [Rhodocyclaceae bacterium]TNC99255.1 MAG: multi-sensor hybrid histidine kinase [Rhodocyclaceae bacterium]
MGRILPRLEPVLFPLHRGFTYRVAIVLILVTIAFVVRRLIGPPEFGVPFLTFFPAAAISAVFGGFWAGMLATALGSIAATYFFLPPYSMFSFEFRYETVFSNIVYILDEIVVCSAIAALHRFYRVSKDQNAELKTLIQTIPDLIWLKNPEGVYLEFNPAIERFYGLRRDTVIGRTTRDLFPDAVATAIQRQDQAALTADGPQTNEEWVIRTSDGSRVLLETTTTPMRTVDGTLIGVLGIARDITESRLLEDQLRAHTLELERERTFLGAIFEHTGDGILAVDGAGNIALANQSARRLLGMTEGDLRRRLVEFWSEWPAIADETADRAATRRDLDTAGHVLALSVTRTGEPGETRYVIVARDVSEEHRLADERRELDRQMFQMENMATLGELAMGVAHEIGNPLAGMKAVAQSLQYEDDLPADTREALRRLEAEIDRLGDFLRSFHGFAAPQRAHPVPCRLRDIVEDILFWIRKEAVSHDVAIGLAIDEHLSVRADPNQIKQVLLNLVVNAIHAMPHGGALRIAATNDAGNGVRIEVADTGGGIGADVLPRIFDPFFTTRATGSGLGLAVVKKIVTEHDAQIEVRSQAGHGSCFTLLWPAA